MIASETIGLHIELKCMRKPTQKPIIIMQPGPIHLFWTTGVFYFWLLKDNFDFVLIVPEGYRENELFAKVEELKSMLHVEYFLSGGLKRHIHCSKRFQLLLRQYRPVYLLLHNRSYIENQYLIHWAHKICPNSIRYYYQNGRTSLMWESDFSARRAVQVEGIMNRFPLFRGNPKFVGKLSDGHNNLAYLINFKIFPLLVMKMILTPPVNVYNGYIDHDAMIKLSNTRRGLPPS